MPTCLLAFMHFPLCLYPYMSICLNPYTPLCRYAYIHLQVNAYMSTCLRTYMPTCPHAYMLATDNIPYTELRIGHSMFFIHEFTCWLAGYTEVALLVPLTKPGLISSRLLNTSPSGHWRRPTSPSTGFTTRSSTRSSSETRPSGKLGRSISTGTSLSVCHL